jgi:predicted nucleic acid-binding protein
MRRNSNLRLADAVIAATASVTKGILLTHDLGLLGVPTIQAIAPQLKVAP